MILVIERFEDCETVSAALFDAGTNQTNVLFFSPGGVSSLYSGKGSSFADPSLLFFSCVLDGAAVAGSLRAAFACFSAYFLSFSAFLRSLSTTETVRYQE